MNQMIYFEFFWGLYYIKIIYRKSLITMYIHSKYHNPKKKISSDKKYTVMI